MVQGASTVAQSPPLHFKLFKAHLRARHENQGGLQFASLMASLATSYSFRSFGRPQLLSLAQYSRGAPEDPRLNISRVRVLQDEAPARD
jgi:hypothetical protein